MGYEAKDYRYETSWSADDDAFVCRVVDFPGIAAHGDAADEALREAHAAVEGGLTALAAKKKPAPEPWSKRTANGRVLVRMAPELHTALLEDAERGGVSLNALIVQRLAHATGEAHVVVLSKAQQKKLQTDGMVPLGNVVVHDRQGKIKKSVQVEERVGQRRRLNV